MSNRFIVFDVETPNYANDRISAIGITVVQDGGIFKEYYSLVNPEAHFDSFNIQLTGITPKMIEDQPTFPLLWQQILPIMDSGLLVAHNAPFDMGVLAKCLHDYNIVWQTNVDYACTCTMGRVCYPQLGNHKLNTICDHLGIDFNHHHAGSDSHACASLLLDYLQRGIEVERYARQYNLAIFRTSKSTRHMQPSESTKQLAVLKALLNEVTADGELSEQEVFLLQNWMDRNLSLCGNYPFDKVFEIVSDALADGILEKAELQAMFQLFEKIVDPVTNACDCKIFHIQGKTFCLTGEFNCGSRSFVQEKLSQIGGIPVKNVSRNTDYLIVGSRGRLVSR